MRKKSDRLKNILWAIVIVLIALLLIGASVAKGGQATTYTVRTVTVGQGDTLWDYWDGSMRWDKWLHETKKLNNMEQSGLQEGQVIKILEVAE